MALVENDVLMKCRVIILDFDGTIIESVGIKDAAFYELFKGFSEHIDKIMAYHLSHNATIRFEKFEFIYRNILKQPYDPTIREDLSRWFSDLVFNKIVECPFVKGAMEFLEHFVGILPLYIVSMSPEEELNRILYARGLTRFFRGIYSSNYKKPTAIKDILKREGIQANEAILIGDANEDFLAARDTGVFFLGRNSGKIFESERLKILEDFDEIKTSIGHLVQGSKSRLPCVSAAVNGVEGSGIGLSS